MIKEQSVQNCIPEQKSHVIVDTVATEVTSDTVSMLQVAKKKKKIGDLAEFWYAPLKCIVIVSCRICVAFLLFEKQLKKQKTATFPETALSVNRKPSVQVLPVI